jgi:hypothetical protein
MKILTLLTLMAVAYFVARGDQHAGRASNLQNGALC